MKNGTTAAPEEAFMLVLFLLPAYAADSIDVAAISAGVDTCLTAVRAEFDKSDPLPSLATAASVSAEMCSREPALAMRDLDLQRAAEVDAYRAARARLDSAKPDAPALSGRVSSPDTWVSGVYDRARASAVVEPEAPPEVSVITASLATIERLGKDREVLDDALDRVSEDVRRYLAVRDGLYLMDCTGEIDLEYPETMPIDARYSYAEQCRQLTEHRSGTTVRDFKNPGAAKR